MKPIYNIPTDESLVTDMQVLEAFDYSIPELNQVKQALDVGNIEEAKKELVDYFHQRKCVNYFYDFRYEPIKKIPEDINPFDFQASLNLKKNIKEFCLECGEKLMDNIYIAPGKNYTCDLGKNLENMPHFNFLTDIKKKHRSPFSIFSRGAIFEYLMFLFHETEDPKVVEKYDALLNKFFEQYPLKIQNLEVDANRLQYDEDRDVMNIGWLAVTFTGMLYTEMTYQLPYASAFEIIKRIWFLGIQFRRYDTDGYRPYNHHMWERGLVPFIMGTCYPEIPAFVDARDHGAKIVSRHVVEDFTTDGGYNEHSITYWYGAAIAEMIYRGVQIGKLNGNQLLNEDAMNRVRKSLDLFAIISPSGDYMPTVGDNGPSLIDEILILGSRSMDSNYCKELYAYRCGSGEEPKIPYYYGNDKTGFTCARTGYGPNSTYMLMSTKVNCGISGHNHMDMLSMILHVHGEVIFDELLTGLLYKNATMKSPQRGYMYNMRSHNTVLAYGRTIQPDEVYANQFGIYRPDSPIDEYETYERGMCVSAYHYGYTYCSHRRSVQFAKNGTMLITDQIHRGHRLDDPHKQIWHIPDQVEIMEQTDNHMILGVNDVRVLCLWDKPVDIEVNDVTELYGSYLPDGKEKVGQSIEISFESIKSGSKDGSIMSTLNMLVLDVTGRDYDKMEVEKRFLELTNRKRGEAVLEEKDRKVLFLDVLTGIFSFTIGK